MHPTLPCINEAGRIRIKYERPTALYKWKEMYYYARKNSLDKCRLCDAVETIEHCFYQCTYNKFFWQEVSKFVQKALDINIWLYDLDILFRVLFEEDMFIIRILLYSIWEEI